LDEQLQLSHEAIMQLVRSFRICPLPLRPLAIFGLHLQTAWKYTLILCTIYRCWCIQ